MLVPVGDERELCRAMERLIASPELRRRMGREGLRSILNGHLIGDTTRKYIDLFLGRGQIRPAAEPAAAESLPVGVRQAS
jgi:glycosyltransferase involved in cell wall biosynthesis